MTEPSGMIYDVAVLGLGAMGSAAAYHLSRRGVNVLGLDQFNPPHTQGSSHGETRVIREAYFEHPSYVPLVQRAYELWAELEEESQEKLYLKTGGIMIGAADSTVVRGATESAEKYRLAHEVLDSREIKSRYPALNPSPGMKGVVEPRAGILFPEKCISAYLRLAQLLGAEICTEHKVTGWELAGDHVNIRTAIKDFAARKIIISAGPWSTELLQHIVPLQVERQVLLWFQASDHSIFGPDRFPIHLWEYESDKMFYGFPGLGSGVKVAFHHQGEITTADSVNRDVTEADIETMRVLLRRFLPAANGDFLRGTVCLYTNTPDGHFILDRHPQSDRVIIASPCSGHGFKFASAIGEVLADLVLDGKSTMDLSLFRLNRFGRNS